jgi:hypothetical protein
MRRAEAGWQDAEAQLRGCREELHEVRAKLAEAEADGCRHRTLRDRLTTVAGLSLPVYVTTDLCLSAQPGTGSGPNRVCVCSIPKSGTYLVSELLRLLGYEATRLHLWTEGFSDYRTSSMRQAREEYERFTVPLHLSKSLGLVLPGQFAVGHLECTDEVRARLAPFKAVFTYRNLRDAVVSHMRFMRDTSRGGPETQTWKDLPEGPEKMLRYLDSDAGASFFRQCRSMIDWPAVPGVFKLPFESLYGDHGERAQLGLIEALHRFLDVPGELADPGELVHDLIGKPTLTWSGRRTERGLYWNDAVEERFRSLGGHEINAALGYGSEGDVL